MKPNVKKIIDNVYSEYREPWSFIQNSMRRLMTARILVTLFIITWAIVLSYYLTRKPSTKEQEQEAGEHRAKYFYLHRVWFGEESVLMIIFKIWVWVIVLMLLAPLLRQLIIFLRVREAIG